MERCGRGVCLWKPWGQFSDEQKDIVLDMIRISYEDAVELDKMSLGPWRLKIYENNVVGWVAEEL